MTVPSVDAIDLPRKLSGDKLSKFREPEAASTFRLRTNSDEIFQPALLAKFVSVPIYNEVGAGPAEREIAAAGGSGEVMTSIDDVDLDTYCGRVGNLYGRYGL